MKSPIVNFGDTLPYRRTKTRLLRAKMTPFEFVEKAVDSPLEPPEKRIFFIPSRPVLHRLRCIVTRPARASRAALPEA